MLYYIGKEGDFKIMVTELLGDDLRIFMGKLESTLSLKTCMMIADQIVCILQFLHDRGIVYNDMKPDNFCVGGEANYFHIHMVDFGLSQIFKDKNGAFIAEEKNSPDITSN